MSKNELLERFNKNKKAHYLEDKILEVKYNELKEFKSKFTESCRKANDRFHDAIAAIDASIKKLEDTKKALLVSEGHLNAAENHSNGLTIRKLTLKNPTMKQKFMEARELNTVTYEVLED